MIHQPKPIMADVARRAGVSTMTVSRVLRGHPNVRVQTRTRVEEAIEALAYRTHAAARTLAGGPSGVIGVVCVAAPYFGPSNTLFGIEAAARARGFSVSLVTLGDVGGDGIRHALRQLQTLQVDGAIVVAPTRAAVTALPDDESTPTTVICAEPEAGQRTVSVDQVAGARLATRHLLDQGHDTVYHLRGPREWIDADARAAGWRMELRTQMTWVPRALVGDWTARSGYRAGVRLATDRKVTAVFAGNDQMAIGVLRALVEAGRRVPDDVAVVGFDDVPEARFLTPPLTTVRQDFDLLGREAVDSLLQAMDSPELSAHRSIAPRLVVRRSSQTAEVYGR
jgi:DNA-binding LacI/PurR family transcriptional regulator